MTELTINRKPSTPEGTFGTLEGEALRMHTGELPWKNNAVEISCIPAGTYICEPHNSPHHGQCFWVKDVQGRTEILVHVACWMGDTEKGFKSDLLGCIGIGMKFVKDAGENDQDMLQQSRIAMDKLIEYTGFKRFKLTIKDAS